MRTHLHGAALALFAALALAGCNRGADSGATANPNAQGQPGTGNGREVSMPSQPDSSSGRGPSGVAGSMPHPGSSGGDAPPNTTGMGAAGAAQPGTGLTGGLGQSGGIAPGQATSPAEGTKNSTSKSSVGNR